MTDTESSQGLVAFLQNDYRGEDHVEKTDTQYSGFDDALSYTLSPFYPSQDTTPLFNCSPYGTNSQGWVQEEVMQHLPPLPLDWTPNLLAFGDTNSGAFPSGYHEDPQETNSLSPQPYGWGLPPEAQPSQLGELDYSSSNFPRPLDQFQSFGDINSDNRPSGYHEIVQEANSQSPQLYGYGWRPLPEAQLPQLGEPARSASNVLLPLDSVQIAYSSGKRRQAKPPKPNCLTCLSRKVRCPGPTDLALKDPCATCLTDGSECTYVTLAEFRKRRKSGETKPHSPSKQRVAAGLRWRNQCDWCRTRRASCSKSRSELSAEMPCESCVKADRPCITTQRWDETPKTSALQTENPVAEE